MNHEQLFHYRYVLKPSNHFNGIQVFIIGHRDECENIMEGIEVMPFTSHNYLQVFGLLYSSLCSNIRHCQICHRISLSEWI